MLYEPEIFEDERGFFFESYNEAAFSEALGEQVHFVQDNYSHSIRNVLRGLHLQVRKPQGKLVRVTHGTIFDVTVDLRRDSPTYSKWFGVNLDAKKHQQLWIPPGLAHGFLTMSEQANLAYKVTDYYDPGFELSLQWNDSYVKVKWPKAERILVSRKDDSAKSFWEIVAILND